MSTKYGISKHKEHYRVVTYDDYPKTQATAHNARYFDSMSKAIAAFQISVINMFAGNSKSVRISLEYKSNYMNRYKVVYVIYDCIASRITEETPIL